MELEQSLMIHIYENDTITMKPLFCMLTEKSNKRLLKLEDSLRPQSVLTKICACHQDLSKLKCQGSLIPLVWKVQQECNLMACCDTGVPTLGKAVAVQEAETSR